MKTKINYEAIPRELIYDSSLSTQSRFLYVYMTAKPDDWNFYLEPLAKEIGWSRSTLKRFMNELIQTGWIIRVGLKRNGNRNGSNEYIINDFAGKQSFVGSRVTGSQMTGSSMNYNNNRYYNITDTIENTLPNKSFTNVSDLLVPPRGKNEKTTDFENYEIEETKSECLVSPPTPQLPRQQEEKEKSCAKKEREVCDVIVPDHINKQVTKELKLHKLQQQLSDSLIPFVSVYGNDMIRNFFKYWSEPNKSHSNCRWNMEKTWDISRRLSYWSNHSKTMSRDEQGLSNSERNLRRLKEHLAEEARNLCSRPIDTTPEEKLPFFDN